MIDVRKLYGQTGMFTYDPGFTSTASCSSKITFIDGDEGVLLHRGYTIEDLAKNSSFLEVAYLILNGELPKKAEFDKFVQGVTYHTMVHEQIQYLFRGFRRDAHPMAVMIGVIGALSAFYYEDLRTDDPHHRMIASFRLIAKIPTIAAMCYKYSIGQPFVYPRNDLTYAENFLHMMFAVPCEPYKVNPTLAKALDRIFILHADHEQNASTSTVRLVGSTGASPYAAIAAGIAALWGPAHGGANEAVVKMLAEIGSTDDIPEFIAKAKDKESHSRLMGFGHRVYKNYDPARRRAQGERRRRAGPARPEEQPQAGDRQGAGADRAQRRVFRPAQAVPERRLLLGHHPRGDGHPDHDVHRHLRHGADGRLGGAVERDDRGSGAEDRPAAAALHRPPAARATCRSSERAERPQPAMILAMNSASAARLPSTRARPPNFHTPILLRRTVISTRS